MKRIDSPKERIYRMAYARYKCVAKKYDRTFDLTEDIFFSILDSPCAYCGSIVGNVKKDYLTGDMINYMGIDRIDSMEGYIEGNVAPCCYICNKAKSNLSMEQFVSWVTKAYKHMVSDE